jgi:hypothetical protein
MKYFYGIFLTFSLIWIISCTPEYVPEPNKVAFASTTWVATGVIDGEEWITIYQLGTADTDRDHYIKYHVDTEKTTAIEGIHYNILTPDSCLIPKRKYIGYIKLDILDFELSGNEPRLTLVLDGNNDILAETGFDVCHINIRPYN